MMKVPCPIIAGKLCGPTQKPPCVIVKNLSHNSYAKEEKRKDFISIWLPLIAMVSFLLCCALLMYNNKMEMIRGMKAEQKYPLLKIEIGKVIYATNEKFLSIGLDTSIIQKGWRKFDLDSTVIATMVSALSPAYFRFGGTAADYLIFDPNSTVNKSIKHHFEDWSHSFNGDCELYQQNLTMTESDWRKINNFTKAAGLDLIFDLNVLLRDGEKWDPSNALKLIKFSKALGFNLSWQLGNEPNSFCHVFQKFIPGTQLAKDFRKLREILNEVYGSHVPLVGPDVTRPHPPNFDSVGYLIDFLKEINKEGNEVIDAVTWHHYYLNGRNSTVEDFLDPQNFQTFYYQIQLVGSIVSLMTPGTPIWLTETSDAYGGGAPNITDRFAGGFLWLDKLGLAAANGIEVVTRQSIFGGYYALIDEDIKPLPDFWLSILYKKLVGTKVLGTTLMKKSESSSSNEVNEKMKTLRFYSHCTSSQHPVYNKSSITVFGLNVGPQAEEFSVSIASMSDNSFIKSIDAYILTGEKGLQSRYTLLNGNRLELNEDGTLPAFVPVNQRKISLPAHSLGFWVLSLYGGSVCN